MRNKVAVLIPCYNEELTVEKVVSDFKRELPKADIYVYDNNSKDKTAQLAKKAGAIVVPEFNQGKGYVVRSMFTDIDADYYVLVDGDDTYPADEVHEMLKKAKEGYDMVIGDRLSSTYYTENKRPFHNFGNDLVRWLINRIFVNNIKDIMTGYRVFSKKFVKTVAIMSPGFQIETEMTITALEYRYNVTSIPITYRDRPEGSTSKLNTISDGIKVLITLFDLAKDYRPLWFFTIISFFVCIFALILLRFSVIASSIFFLISVLLIVLGLILDHEANIDKKNHELYVKQWLDNNK